MGVTGQADAGNRAAACDIDTDVVTDDRIAAARGRFDFHVVTGVTSDYIAIGSGQSSDRVADRTTGNENTRGAVAQVEHTGTIRTDVVAQY